jgi:hypothetical protein
MVAWILMKRYVHYLSYQDWIVILVPVPFVLLYHICSGKRAALVSCLCFGAVSGRISGIEKIVAV